jgi:hypothetical protein
MIIPLHSIAAGGLGPYPIKGNWIPPEQALLVGKLVVRVQEDSIDFIAA